MVATDMVRALDNLIDKSSSGGRRKSKWKVPLRKTRWEFNPKHANPAIDTGKPYAIYSYNCQDWAYKKKTVSLPTMARGLFIHERHREGSGEWEIVARGYDKFFNVGEVPATTWKWLEENTTGPYEVTVKENGCIIFAGAVVGNLLVTSKHALGPSQDPARPSHAQKGEEWLQRHIAASRSTTKDFVEFLEKNDATAVFELADDDFEEHILEYPPERRGLFLHGITDNTPEFSSWPFSKVKPVADKFGFLVVGCLTFDTLAEVRTFTDKHSKTGSYDGRAVEGFVVRCLLNPDAAPTSIAASGSLTHFFKVKYDNPYLMFREWREVTKAILGGRDKTWKPRFELTRRYMEWVRRKVKEDPKLFEEYKYQKGIIRARKMFLQDAGLGETGESIISEAEHTTPEFKAGQATYRDPEELERQSDGSPAPEDGQFSPSQRESSEEPGWSSSSSFSAASIHTKRRQGQKTLILPIAVIGAGKTTLGLLLNHLFGSGHIQSDNITAKRAGPVFERTVIDEFRSRDVVYADKNNHLGMHRQNITKAFKAKYPNGFVLALDWQIEKERSDDVINIAAERVEQRGENHQSLTPQRTSDYIGVIHSFTVGREPLNLSSPADRLIDQVVPLRITNHPYQNLEAVCKAMGWEVPSHDTFEDVMKSKVDGYQVTVRKVVKGNIATTAGPGGATEKSGKGPVKYYGLRINEESCKDLKERLSRVFDADPDCDRTFFDHLVKKRRIENRFHVTLSLNPEKYSGGKNRAIDGSEWDKRNARLFEQYSKVFADSSTTSTPSSSSTSKPLNINPESDLPLEICEALWDGRVMCCRVSRMPDGVESANTYPHITLGTRDDKCKPMWSNEILNYVYSSRAGEGIVGKPVVVECGGEEAGWRKVGRGGKESESDGSVIYKMVFPEPIVLKSRLLPFYY
ncbi:hypothetical protein HK102_014140 [Quaeritorhiza haematococci]|nr:hypothetical protein HK102_014140 [Quaeritorhiza haematococci]